MGVHRFPSVVPICSKLNRDSQTRWVFTHSCQWLPSAGTLESDSLPGWAFTHSCQWLWSAHILERDSRTGWVFMHCQWFQSAQTQRGTHCLDGLPILISGSHLLGHWRATHLLKACSTILLIFFLSQALRVTHSLDAHSAILISSVHAQNQLTVWMHIQSFLWAVLTLLESNLHPWCNFQFTSVKSHTHVLKSYPFAL